MLDQSTSSICYFQGRWHTGPVAIYSSEDNASWLANAVFDGARAFEGVAPDLDRHCQRIIRSAQGLKLVPTKTWEEIHALAAKTKRAMAGAEQPSVRARSGSDGTPDAKLSCHSDYVDPEAARLLQESVAGTSVPETTTA